MAAAIQNYTIEQGQTLYSLLTVQLPGVVFNVTGNTTVGSTSVTNISNTTGLAVGMSVTGPNFQVNTIITNISGTTLTISNAASATGTAAALAIGAFTAVNLTGVTFLFSANVQKPDNYPTSPTAIEFNWTETSTPLQGQTWFTLPAATTKTMVVTLPPPATPNQYYYQIWVTNAPGLPAVSPLLEGLILVTQPVSNRSS